MSDQRSGYSPYVQSPLRIAEALVAGKQVYADGVLPSACTYPEGSDESAAWHRGYTAARLLAEND
ncbi:hypothetical protein [Sphingomonas sp. IC4-52]|uniref:hypothetical protein n=1 Tax=Sphingomonas sp. IC4-52 TaxID=2887202 RepID=UPI001D11B07A|nr:hypothetical protein [Sphingomonas sp. IC4-52]MCC2979055.1 hypothetical protein [Sphingomonas sp. IC4-52]